MGVCSNRYTTTEGKRVRVQAVACVPPWLLLVMDDVHTLRQTHSFINSTLTLMLVWICSCSQSTRAHSDLRAHMHYFGFCCCDKMP